MTGLTCPKCRVAHPDGSFLVEHQCRTLVTAVVTGVDPLQAADVDSLTDRTNAETYLVCEECGHRWRTTREIVTRNDALG